VESADLVLDPEAERQLKSVWWVFFLLALATAVLGVIVIFRPLTGVVGLAVLIAATLIVSGVGDILGAAQWRHRWVPVLWGIVSIAAGVATLVWPSITLWALAVVIGIALIFRGVMRAMASIMGRPPIWGFWLVVGLIELAAGVLALVWPEITILALAVVIGIDLLIVGLVGLAAAVRSRRLIA
jgi:uncharacterized membrane protein HdeD (DUF308 family)